MNETELLKRCFQRCLKCNKQIDDGEPFIIAYKYGIGEWFCKDHIDDAKKYLDDELINQGDYIMTKGKILKQLETAEGIYGYMYGKQYYIVAGTYNKCADRLLFIEKDELQICEDGLFYRWGYPGPEWNVYYFEDYGKTWAFTKDDLEPNPYPREEGINYDD